MGLFSVFSRFPLLFFRGVNSKVTVGIRVGAATCLALLSACNHEKGSDPVDPPSSVISGYAASGRAIPLGSMVRAKCLEGMAETTTAENGSFSLNVEGFLFPCLLQAKYGSGESIQLLHSFATAPGKTQITPLTQASIARALVEIDPAAVFAAPSETQLKKMADDLPAAETALRGLLTDQGLATPLTTLSGSFFTMPLLPATATQVGDDHDLLLDSVMAHFGGTDALTFTLVTSIPGRPDTTKPPPTPKTGLVITPSPIVLGALSTSFTDDEATAATRLVSITNYGPGSRAIAPYLTGYQSGTITSTQVIGEANASQNQPACFDGLTLAVGATCWVRLSWRPGHASQEVPLAGPLQGKFEVRIPNTMTELVSATVTAELDSRSYIQGEIAVFPGTAGYKVRNLLTLKNVGDVTGSFSVSFSSPTSAPGAFYEDPTRPGQKTCTGSLDPGKSCTIPYVFCWGTPLEEDERIRSTLIIEGNSVNTTVELIASNRLAEPLRHCGGPSEEM